MSVNINTEIEREDMIMSGLRLLLVSDSEPAKITGNSGNTHGARTVNMPAINETMSNVMISIIIS